MSIDSIGDFLTIIRNGLMIGKRSVTAPSSGLKVSIANVLKAEGYIKEFEQIEEDGKLFLTVHLKYVNGEPAIHEITRISKPSRRHYERSDKLKSVIGGLGISIITTSSGVMTDQKARKLSVGGEVLCHVW
jgi:small subunit ribosomal protein S8